MKTLLMPYRYLRGGCRWPGRDCSRCVGTQNQIGSSNDKIFSNHMTQRLCLLNSVRLGFCIKCLKGYINGRGILKQVELKEKGGKTNY